MLYTISEHVTTLLPHRRKTSSSGWISFNAVCCSHNGETADTRGRGGIAPSTDGSVSYHCFNCGFKAHYQPGRHLSYKFRKLLSWLGASDNDIKRLVIEAIRIKDLVDPTQLEEKPEEKIEFAVRSLPEHALSFRELSTFHVLDDFNHVPTLLNSAVDYVVSRGIDTNKYDFYWTDETDHSLHQRVLVPCIWEGKIIGYTGRTFVDGVKPKYYSHYEPNFVFNINQQHTSSKVVVVCEGPFDAMSIDGVAILGNECSTIQADIIDRLGKEVIVVPDNDRAGIKLIDSAIEYGWSVAFPIWQETCKDINEAVCKYGKLFVIKSILASKETSRLKIELMKKRLHN